MFKKLEILLGFILIVIAGLFISCNVNPFFGVGVEVDLEEPKLAVTSHISGDFVNSSFTISGTCRDNKGVVKVQIQLNGTNPLVTWDATIEGNTIEGGTWVRDLVFPVDAITNTREGDKLLDIFAYDERGNRAQTRMYLTVDDDSPTVTITDPILKTPEFFNQLIASDASSDFINLEYFSNGILQIKGYADDTFIINSTKLDIYDSEDLTTSVKSVTIKKDRALPAEAGENSFPSKFTFNIDTTGFTNNRAYLVSVSTEDMAGNKNSQTSMGYFYLDQDKDRPNGKISSPSGSPAITFPQSTASGTIWDDDGLSGYYWYLGNVDTNTANFKSWKTPKGYNAEGSSIVVTDEVAWGYVDLSSDVPPKILSWQMVTANEKGTFYMYIVPVDVNGLTPVVPISKMFVQKTSDAPTLSIISPDSRTTQRGEIKVALNATGGEDKKVTLLSYRIEGIVKYPSDLSSDYQKINVIGDTDSNGNLNGYVIPIDSLLYVNDVSHDIKLSVYCTNDNSEDSRILDFYLRADNDGPKVKIDNPVANSGLNGKVTVSGTAEDDYSGVKTLYFGYFDNGVMTNALLDSRDDAYDFIDSSSDTTLSNITLASHNRWHKVVFSQAAWSYEFDTTKLPDGNNRFYVAAADAMGNVGYTSVVYLIDQELDKPNATITIPQNDGDVMFPQSVATGEASDDDGLGYIYWFIGKTSINFGGGAGEPTSDYASWGSYAGSNASAGRIDLTANNPKAYSWQLTTPKGTGDYKIHILPVDMNGVAASAKTVKSFTQKSLDKPVLKIDGPDPKNTYNGNVTLTFSMNAGEGKILDRIYIKIENDNTVDLVIPGSVGLINGYTYTFDITKYVDANNHDVSISAYCSNTESDKEYSAVATLNLKADNWAPTVVISGPAANSGLNGSAIISGTAQDDWSGVKTLYFGYFKTPPADLTPDYNTVSKLDAKASADIGAVNGINVFWHKVGFTQAAWSYGYNTNKITTTIHNDYKLYVAAVDAMGNVGWSSAIYDINQDLDKPGARILAPTEGSSTFPRSVASGDATDDDGLDYIYYYIGKSNVDPGVYTSWGDVSTDDAKSGRIDLSATAPTVAAWKIDQTPGDTGEFTIHIVPVDKFGTAGIKRTLTYTQNTSSTPQVQIVSPNPSINNKGDIVVSIRATAGGEFKVAAIKYDLSSDIKSDFDEVTILDPGTWGAVVDYSLPAFDSTLFTNNAVHDIIVDVWCVNSNGDESQKTRTYLKADNVAPANSITNPAEGEGMNGIWPVYGSISDDWSGVDALYFSYYKGAEPASSTYDTLAKIEAKASENLSEVDGTTKIWHKVDFTQAAWSYDFDTEIITSGAKSYKLIVASVDKVGNVGWVSRTYNIDQELDYPHSKIIIPLANGNTFPQSVVSAEASDDDGVAKVFWRIKLGDPEGIGDPDLTTGWGTSDPTNDMSGIIDVDGSPRSYPFQLNTPKGDGKFTIYTQTYDVNGKLQKVATTRTYYQYASNDPHIQVKSPTNLSQTFTGAMKVVVRASGGANYNVNSLKYRITSDKPFDSGLKDATITVGNIVDATIDINTATYTSASVHDIKVEIYCVNEKGVSSSVTTLNLKADNTAPTTLNISSPDAGSGLNGLAVISGAVQDDWSGIDALYFGYFASMTDAIMNSTYNTKAKLDAAVADKTLGKWSKVSAPTAAWSYSFDTTKITSTQANPYNLYVAAVDKVGNVKYTSRSFFIDQDLDIPGSCVNIPTAADITFPGSTANGEATDDDGLARLHYYIGTAATPTPTEPNAVTGWGATTGDGSNDIYGTITIDGTPKSYPWSIKTPTGQEEYHIYLWSVDEHNVMQATPTKRTYSQFASRMPTVNIIGLSASDTYGGEVDLTFDAYGGANFNVTEIEYRIYSTHNYDLTWKVIDVADAKISEGLTFDTSLYTDADCHTITIEVKCTNDDGSGATSNVATFSVKADNTPPNIEITNPNSGSKLNGLATIMGTSTDDWSGVKAIYIGYFADMTNALMDSDYSTEADLSADTRAVPTLGKWIKISPTAAWSYQFNTTVIGNDSSYPLYVAAVDNKGNVKYTSRTFDVDQDSDRPTINILAPLDGSTVTPQSAVTGNAIDDDGVRYIYVYIVKSGHATYDNPPDDYTTWGNTHNNDVSGCIIDLSSKNSPINYSWTAITPNNSATYKVYAFAADKNTPTDYNSSPRLYSQRSSTYYVSSAYDVIEIIQKTTESPIAEITNSVSDIYSGVGNYTVNFKFTGGAGENVLKYYYDISSDIKRFPVAAGTFEEVAIGTPSNIVSGSFVFDASGYFNSSVRNLAIKVKCSDETHGDSNIATYYLRADSRNPSLSITEPLDNTKIDTWLASGGWLRGSITDDVVVDRITIRWVEGGVTWSSSASEITLSAGSTTKTFEKQFTLGLLGNTYLEKNFVITAYDSMNNSTTASLKIAKENTPPDVPVLTTPSGTPLLLGDGPGLTISGTVHDNIEVTDVTIDLVGTAWSWKATLGAGTTDKTWTKTFTNIQTQLGGYGDKTFKVTAYDNQGNSSYLIFTLMGDSTKPVVTVKSHANNASYGNNASFDLTGDATDNIKVTGVSIKWVEGNKTWTDATVTGGDKSKVWKKTFNFVKDGANGLFLTPMADTEQYADKTFEITVTDNQGNESATSIRLTGDNSAPVITIADAEGSNIGTGATFTLNGSVTDNREVVRVTISADGIVGDWDSDVVGDVTLDAGTTSRTWSRTFDILADLGSYASRSFEVTSYDKNGNSSVKRVNLKGDLTAPTIASTLTAPADGKLGTGANFTITGEVTDDIEPVKVEIRLDGVLKATLTGGSDLTDDVPGVKTAKVWTKTFSILGDLTDYSDKTFEVTAYDAQGNTSVKIFNITGDRVKPAISNLSPANNGSIGTGADLTLTGKITDDVLIKYLSIKNIETGTVWDETLDSGTWTSDNGIGFTQVTANKDYNWSITFDITTDLTDYDDKTFEITAKDSQNNEFVSTIRLMGDKTAPTIKSTLDAPSDYKIGTGASFTITGEVTDDIEPTQVLIKYNGSTLHTLTDGSGLTNNPDAKKKTWSALITIASLGGTYSDKTLEIIAVDAQGNQSTKSFNLLGDRTAPFISGTLSSPASGSIGTGVSFTITGEVTDDIEPETVVIKYNGATLHTLTDGSGLTNNPDAKKKTWSALITIASIGGTYSDKTFEIVAYDAQNNSSAKTFTLLGDRTAPTIGATLSVPALTSGVYPLGDGPAFTITGSVTDDIETTKVEIKYNNVVISTLTNGSGLTNNPDVKTKTWTETFADIPTTFVDYSNKMIEIVAYDAQLNSSVKVFSIIGDTTKPTVAITSHANNAALPAVFELSGTCSDNIAVTRIKIELENTDASWDSAIPAQNVILTGGTSWSKDLTVDDDLDATYTDKAFTVYAYDAQGNVSSTRVTFIGDRTAPTVSGISPANGTFVKSTGTGFTLSGTATDLRQNGVTAGVVTKVMVKTGVQDHTADFSSAPNWSISSSLFTLTETSYTFEISAYDDLGNIKTERVYVTVDNSPPTVAFSSPADDAALNGTVTVAGTVSDNSSGTKALYISYFASAPTLTNFDEESELEAEATTDISAVTTDWAGKNLFKITGFTASWSHNYDTTKIFNDQLEHANTIYLFAVDNNGNVATTTSTPVLKTKAVKINQSLDKPTASILVPVANGVMVFPESTATGSANDDDGLDYVYIFIGKTSVYDTTTDLPLRSTWNTYSDATACGYIVDLSTDPTNYSWSVKTPGGTGTYRMWVLPVDINTPATEGAYAIRTFNQETSSTPSISVLTNPSTTYMGDLTIDVQATGGGTKTVKSIGYRIESTEFGPTEGTLTGVSASPGVDEFIIAASVTTAFKFDTSLYTSDTVVDIKVDVWVTNEDDVASQESTVYYRADNTKPVVTITSPDATTTINGNQYISGTANDWSQVDALYFGYFASDNTPDMSNDYVTKSQLDANSVLYPADPTTDKWHKVASPSLNWTYSFETDDVTTDIDAGFKLYVAAVDKIGNVNHTTRAYVINQDMDMPEVWITNPSYSGAPDPTVRNDGEMAFIPRTYVMMGTVQDGDADGIENVHIDIDILDENGDHSADVYPSNGTGTVGDGYNEVSSYEPMILGDSDTSWTLKISNYALSLPGEFYRVRVRPKDVNGKLGLVKTSYFVITNVAPEVEIISPSIMDPDTPETTNPDVYGTVISNVKDDMYWDADSSNNLIYYDDDSNRRNWGWNADLNEDSFNIFDSDVSDDTKSNYYRMIFRAKDNGRINSVEISVDGGANTAAQLSWSGGITSADGHFDQTINDTSKIKAVDVMKKDVLNGNYLDYTYTDINTPNDATSDWIYFFVDIDTTKLSTSATLKVIVGDNNDPTSYETTGSVQVNVDNSAPTGRVLNWGIDSLTETYEFSKTGGYEYIGGDLADVGSAGVRYANLYFWENMQPDLDATPNYKENGSGLITVDDSTNVPSGVHKVSIPENLGSVLVKNLVGDIGDVDPASSDYDNYPNNWIRAYKYLSSGWRIKKIYTNDESPSDADGNPGTYYGISTKYGSTYPSDGKKLICLEIVDNAGNKLRKFYEHTFSEYPPTVLNANISSAGRPEEAVTDETTAGRKWISQTFSMNGFVRDYVAGTNPNPGIERVRVYIMKDDNGDGVPESTQKIYTSKTSDTVADPKYSSIAPTVVIDTTADISAGPTSTDAQVEWGIDLAQSIAALADGNYMIMVEVRDKTGSTDTMKQYVYIDNSDPTLVVSQPTAAQVVKGDMFAISGTASDVAGGGFDAGCINIKILDGVTVKREWNASLDPLDVTSPYDWSQEWSLISDASDDFDESETRIVRVTLTDKSGNTVTATDITVTKGAPPSWPTFTANGSSTAFANATFKSKYATIGASDPLFMIKGSDSVFTTNINDTTQFTSAKLIVNGYKQSDGSLLNSGNTPALADKSMNIKTGNLIVGENDLGVDDVYTYAGLPDGEYAYKVELHQEAAVINMQKYFIVDNTKPNIWVKKIENTDFNGYGTSTLNGHVDASHDNWGAGYTTGADAVSGVIQLQVKVKDNYLLKNIKAKMTSYSFGTGDNTDVILLQRDASGVWGTPASRGALGDLNYFAVKDVVQSLGTDYDYVVFTLEFNTANLTGVAGINKTLQFTAEDWVGNTTNEAGTNKGIEKAPFDLLTYTSSMSLTYAKPVAFTLDVVPYISGLTTGLESGTLSFVKRSSTGKYPIKYSTSTTDLLRISGYNLGSASAPTIAIGTVSPTIQTRDSAKYTWVDIRKNATKSGLLSVSTGTIVSTNNINDNDLPTNEETATYFPDRDDNRYVAIWQIATSAYSGKTEAVMKPNSGRTDMDWMYVNNSQTVYLNATSLATSWTLAGGDFTYNSAGTFNYIFLHNMNWSGGSDSYQVHGSVQWGINEGTTVGAYNWHRASTSRLGLGNLSFVDDTEYNYTGGDDKVMDRYKNLQIINNGNNTDTDVFVAYFDKSSITRSIVFWSFKVGTGVTNTTTMAGGWYANIEKITAGNTAANYSSSTNLLTGLKTPYVAGARRRIDVTTVASGKDSEHFDMKYYSNRVYLTYYDETSMALKFKYCSDPINAPQTWSSDVTVDIAAGLYVKTVVDPSGGIHMAYYDNSYSQLKYAYLTSYADTSADVYTVDALFTTGMYNAINIRDFDTSAGTDYRPIISTYSISYAGTKYSARVAYPTTNLSGLGNGADPSTNEYTGKWEVITVCSANAPGQSSTFIETDATANYNGQILVGYNGAYIEEATLLSE